MANVDCLSVYSSCSLYTHEPYMCVCLCLICIYVAFCYGSFVDLKTIEI